MGYYKHQDSNYVRNVVGGDGLAERVGVALQQAYEAGQKDGGQWFEVLEALLGSADDPFLVRSVKQMIRNYELENEFNAVSGRSLNSFNEGLSWEAAGYRDGKYWAEREDGELEEGFDTEAKRDEWIVQANLNKGNVKC
jgi:hypothetical protein